MNLLRPTSRDLADFGGALGLLMSTTYEMECRDHEGRLRWKDRIKNRVVTAGLNKILDAAFKTGLASPAWYIGICSPSVTDGVMTASSPNLACTTSTPFTAGDVGSPIIVKGAGAGQSDLVTTILTFTDSGHVVLNANAALTVASANVIFGARAADTMASHAPWVECGAYSGARPAFTPGAIAAGSVNNSGSLASYAINADNTLIGGAFLTDNSTEGGTTGTLYGMAPMTTIGFRACNNGDTLTVQLTLNAATQ